MKHHTNGFTLIELMIVVAIIALIFGLGAQILSGYLSRSRFQQGVITLQQELIRARTDARRTSIDQRVSWKRTDTENFIIVSQISGGGAVELRRLEFPPRSPLDINPSEGSITYEAPYGRYGSGNTVIQFEEANISVTSDKRAKTDLVIVGVTGKVMRVNIQ